jgi:hypothetical protein
MAVGGTSKELDVKLKRIVAGAAVLAGVALPGAV